MGSFCPHHFHDYSAANPQQIFYSDQQALVDHRHQAKDTHSAVFNPPHQPGLIFPARTSMHKALRQYASDLQTDSPHPLYNL